MPSSDVNAHVFHEQGSTKFTAVSGGEIEMQSGSLLDIQSGSSHKSAGKHTVLSGGEIEMQSGAKGDLQSGSTFTVNGDLDVSGVFAKESTGKIYVKGFTSHSSTTHGRLTNWGHSFVKPTSSGINFRLAAPEAGIDKYITAFTSVATIVHATTATGQIAPRFGIPSTEACVKMRMVPTPIGGAVGLTVHLRGKTTAEWFVISSPGRTTTTGVGNLGDVTFTTST